MRTASALSGRLCNILMDLKKKSTSRKKTSKAGSTRKKKKKSSDFESSPTFIDDETKKENVKISTKYLGLVAGGVSAYIIAYALMMANAEEYNIIDALVAMPSYITQHGPFITSVQALVKGIVFGAIIGGIVYFIMMNETLLHMHYEDEEVVDSGGFMSKREMKAYADKYITPDPPPVIPKPGQIIPYDKVKNEPKYSENMIMSDHFCRPINSRRMIGNNNVLIVGGAGTGKSRFFIKPNVLQMNASYVITDPSGEMIYSLGNVLKTHGYKIKIFNISDMNHSDCYNPLNYIRDEAGVKMLIECLINNTTKGGGGGGDNQFFVDAEKLLYSACIFYLRGDWCKNDKIKNFSGIINMINLSKVDEKNPDAKSELDKMFEAIPQNSLAWKYYKSFKQAAGKTLKSIIISCVTRLQPFLTPQVARLTQMDTLHLENIGREKTALFIITPQADRTYSFLASMLYSQLFETLYYIGEKQKADGKSEQMDIPVRCLMDEFANSMTRSVLKEYKALA